MTEELFREDATLLGCDATVVGQVEGSVTLDRTVCYPFVCDEAASTSIYTHPLGLYGHGPGATIGMWDKQDGVPGTGDVPVAADAAWAIELNVTVDVPEWDGQAVRIMLEEGGLFTGENVRFLDGRQEQLLVIE